MGTAPGSGTTMIPGSSSSSTTWDSDETAGEATYGGPVTDSSGDTTTTGIAPDTDTDTDTDTGTDTDGTSSSSTSG